MLCKMVKLIYEYSVAYRKCIIISQETKRGAFKRAPQNFNTKLLPVLHLHNRRALLMFQQSVTENFQFALLSLCDIKLHLKICQQVQEWSPDTSIPLSLFCQLIRKTKLKYLPHLVIQKYDPTNADRLSSHCQISLHVSSFLIGAPWELCSQTNLQA